MGRVILLRLMMYTILMEGGDQESISVLESDLAVFHTELDALEREMHEILSKYRSTLEEMKKAEIRNRLTTYGKS